jgi:chemotaxis protein methyltransferase CheR
VPVAADIVAGVARVLAERAGLELAAWIVEARTAARASVLGVEPQAYLELIESTRGADELEELVEAVRVGESRLFRHRSQIAVLVDVIAPILRTRRSVRVWSAGCAAGQEPYTLAAVLAKALPSTSVTIVATDVSAAALALAEEGAYPRAALDDVPEEWRDGFYVDGDRVRVRAELARLVRFERANLIEGTTPRDCDLVWCRNVLIYFTQAARATAIDKLVSATVPGGYVFVGYSESLREVEQLEPQRAGDIVYYMRRRPSYRAPTPLPLPAVAPLRTPPAGVRVVPPPVVIEVLSLAGSPDPAQVTAAIADRFAHDGLQSLVIDLDAAELLPDALAIVLRRARAAADSAGIELVLRATRAGAKRWLSRHHLEGGEP